MKAKHFSAEIKNLLWIALAATLSFVPLHVFVLPSDFSPSGVDGISTILYELTGLNVGWFKLMINLPLIVAAWVHLKRKYVIYVTFFTLLESLGVILLDSVGFFTFVPAGLDAADALCYRLISALCSGVSIGCCTGIMLKLGASTGGVDIAAALIGKKIPNYPIERWISIICYCVIGISYFVYWDLTSILLSVIQIFVFEWTAAALLKKDRYAQEVKIITKNPEAIREEILYRFGHSATILDAKGMYSGENCYLVISVINSRDIFAFMNLMKRHEDTFVYFTDGVKVQGAFHFGDQDSKRIDAF
ncbi:MAG: YitT family protein [Oscillospiraceae bacterium]|nr:YitT family protein [Oscillospiraceae bacterium]